MDKEVDCLFCRRLFHSWFFPHTFAIVNANGCFFVLIGRGRHNINFKKKRLWKIKNFQKESVSSPFLRSFMSNSSISIDELAVAMTMSKYAITRLAEGKSYPTDVCYAEFCIMFTVVLGKDFDAYKKMTRKRQRLIWLPK